MKKIMTVFGTRPEAIKMCPIVKELKTRKKVSTVVCVTGQHADMLDEVLCAFDVIPDYNLSVMKASQSLFDVTTAILSKIKEVLEKEAPDVVLVHGDTTSAFAASLACFYLHIPVGHVEAGLRTYDTSSPFPEEFNRQAVSITAKYHFAPTSLARDNLLREGKPEKNIYLTGNTVIDALKDTVREDYTHPLLSWVGDDRLVILTAHRRENIGEPMKSVFKGIRKALEEHSDVKIIYPVHPNPAVRSLAQEAFGKCERIKMTEPLGVFDFHNFLARSYLILSDSGGVQEEASFLGKPLLIMRNTTERPEGASCGPLKLVGTNTQSVYESFSLLLDNNAEYKKMSVPSTVYGVGNASKIIVDILLAEQE